jgi:tetratricopeptide (TPR) repeat protein
MRTIRRICLIALLAFALPSFARADDSWVGKVVIMKEPGVKFGYTEPKTGEEVYLGTLDHMHYKVLADQDGWLRVQHNDKKGWFKKSEAVLADNAVDFFSDMIKANPKDVRAYAHRAAALVWKGDVDAALQDFDEAIRLNPKAAPPWNARGSAWYKKEQFDKAISDYDKAIELEPKYVEAYANRASAWYAKKQFAKAVSDFDKAIELEPKFVDAYASRALAWVDLNQPDKAIKDYDEVIRLDPSFVEAFSNRGVCWRQKKQFDKALRDYDAALQLDPKSITALNSKAFLLATCPDAKFRDGKKAVELARKACEIEEWKNIALIDTLAAAYAEAGEFDEAVKWMTKALSDQDYAKQAGDMGRKMLEQYKQKKPFRDE